MSGGQRAVEFRVFGRVQGVGFRHFVRTRAEEFDLSGWVRNRADGSVEVRAEGSEQAIAALVAACREGPRVARVERVEMGEMVTLAPAEAGHGFRTLPTF